MESKNPRVTNTKKALSKWSVWGSIKWKFIKTKEAEGFLHMLGSIPLIGFLLT